MNKATESGKSLNVVVVGAGVMGHGLALLLAKAGHKVMLVDLTEEILKQAISLIRSNLLMLRDLNQISEKTISEVMERISVSTRMEVLSDAELAIEAISEEPEAKRAFYSMAETLLSPDAIVASNTSFLNVFELAPDSLQKRLLISHFFAPPYLIPLVELVRGPATLDEVIDRMKDMLIDAGQKPVVMEKYIPGFIVNRLQRAMGSEIFNLIDGGYAKPEEIDRAVLASLGIRLPVLGVVRSYDFNGLDLLFNVYSNPSGETNENRAPAALKNLVAKGYLGVKTGKGFYDYKGKEPHEIYEQRDKLLMRMREVLEEIEDKLWRPYPGRDISEITE
ncbi:MAG: 3-hydroxyacyl-CoA dehydrogenase family protein [Desulfomonilaceae bacterium]